MKKNELINNWNELKRENFRVIEYDRLNMNEREQIVGKLGEGYQGTLGRLIARRNYDKILELNEHREVKLSQVKNGEFFRLKPDGPVWVRDEYDRSTKKYDVFKFDDMNQCSQLKGTKQVYIGFTF